MAIVDRHGLPRSVSTHAANHHEVRLVQLCFDFYMMEAKPENLIGDRRSSRQARANLNREHCRIDGEHSPKRMTVNGILIGLGSWQ